jgi:hypothetical protein
VNTEKRPGRFRPLARLVPSRRILAFFSITCTVVYVACWIGEAIHATREKLEHPQPHEGVPQKPLPDRVKENVQRQIEEIQRVDAQDLGFTFLYDLKMWDCNWRFHCVPSKLSADYATQVILFSRAGQASSQRYRALLLQRATTGVPQGNRSSLFTQPLSPGLIPQYPNDKWNAYKNSLGIAVSNATKPQNKASAVTRAGSTVESRNPSDRDPISEWQALAAATLAPSDEADLARELALLTEAPPNAETLNPQNDEPPSPDERAFAFNSAQPKLLVKGPIPTLHTLLGIPRASFVTVRAILKAGLWAITIFLACGILYFGLGAPLIAVLLSSRGKKDWDNPLILISLLLISPVAVPIAVGGVQWGAVQLGNAVSWTVGLWVMVATWSAAISVLVGIPHVWKAPREVKEAYDVVRHGVEIIEKK